jgi:hypothetical protein
MELRRTKAVSIPGKRGLVDSERVFLLAPKERQFDPFGQRPRSKLRRLMTRDDGLDDPRRQEREPSQTPDVSKSDEVEGSAVVVGRRP